MAQPLNLLELPSRVQRGAIEPAGPEATVPLGLGGLDAMLPDGGLLKGGVTELAVAGGAALSTSIALAACRSVQQQAIGQGGQTPWCAFVDPTGTLHAPGVVAAGVELERLLVVRPSLEALGRVAVKLAESHAFSVVIVDTVGTIGGSAYVALGSWPRLVRRLSIAAAESSAVVLLITDRDAQRPLPLPVSMRLELARPKLDRLQVRIAKERRGRVSSERTVRWDRGFISSRPPTSTGIPPGGTPPRPPKHLASLDAGELALAGRRPEGGLPVLQGGTPPEPPTRLASLSAGERSFADQVLLVFPTSCSSDVARPAVALE